MDGGSTDSTLDIIKRYPHLKWISEPDRGQVDALNKGFDMSTGDIIGCLNADDYYKKNAFTSVIPLFQDGTDMFMGKVIIVLLFQCGFHVMPDVIEMNVKSLD